MRYMMLIYSKETAAEMSPEEFAYIRAGHAKVLRAATDKGILQGAEPLARTSSATTVRVEDGKTLITDGPFAETKEQLGGYYLVEAKDAAEATSLAARIPAARYGSVEVRPILSMARPESHAA